MEGITVIMAKKDEKETPKTQIGDHSEAFSFVQENKDFFEHHAKGKIKIEPAPAGLDTFAFNLENNTIYINSMFYEKLGFSKEKTIFATLHEIEHFLEKIQMLSEEGGEKNFEKYLKNIENSKAFSLMDNCVADIRENKTVISRTNKGMKDLEEKIYKEDLFPETDFTSQPRHIQFCQTILREARVGSEKCNVAPEVRNAVDEIAKVKGLMNIMTNPQTPMSTRLKLQDKYIWPKVQELLEKDIEEEKNKEEQEKNEQEGDSKENQEGKEGQEENKDGNENGEDKNDKEQKGEKSEDEKEGKNGKPKKSEDKNGDPNKMFAEDYEKAFKKVPNAVPTEEVKKAFKEWKEEKQKNNPDKVDQEYADKIGVEKEDLQEYRKIAEKLQEIVNPETNVSVMEELKNLFYRIIAKRLKERFTPKYPMEEGDELSDPAQLVSDVRAGNLNPKVWEDTEIKERKGDKFGEVEMTLVCDRSGSMDEGRKAVEQRNSAVMMMEVLKDFAEMCDEEKMKVDKPLEIKSEIYSFASSSEDKVPLKKMSKELGEAERINVLKKLFDLPGSTTDFNCLEAIYEGLDERTKQKIKEGELKKVVFVFTDGGSDSVSKVQTALKKLRDAGVVVVGIGLTKDGEPAKTTYAPNAEVVENVENLPVVLGELLKEHLKDI